MKILILAPMHEEKLKFLSALNELSTKNKYKVVECGIGKTNSAATTALELSQQYDLVVLIGFAAAAPKTFKVGEVVAPNKCVFHDVYDPINIVPELTEPLSLAGFDEVTCLTGDSFVDSKLSETLVKKYGDDVIFDMECRSVAQVCKDYNMPLLLLKVISDIPQNPEESFAKYVSENKDINFKSFLVFIENIT